MAVLILAHSEVKTFNSPMTDPYDKYHLKLHKHVATRLSELADNIFFGDYEIFVSETGEGFNKKAKGIGQGERLIYTEERPAFLAKSRIGLPFKIKIPKEKGWDAVAELIK